MAEPFDVLIRNASLHNRDGVYDVGIRDGIVAAVDLTLEGDADELVDAEERLVSPGFVDCHKHLDRGLAATGDRRPIGNDEPMTHRSYLEMFDDYYRGISHDELVERIVENVEMAVAAGTTHIRSHVNVDHSIGTGTMDACLDAAERTADLVDLELVVAADDYGDDDSVAAVRDAIESAPADVPVLVGGSDGGLDVRERGRELERWFDLATEYGVDLDVHVSARGSTGVETLEGIAELADERDYEGRVTVVHAYALAMIPDWRLEELAETLSATDINVVTCYNSTRSSMPIRELVDAGVSLAHGTDNDRDFVVPHGEADSLDAARILSFKLNYGPDVHRPTRDYRWYETNEALRVLWELVTTQGAAALGIEEYGIEEGVAADLVVLDAPSPEWAIIDRAVRTHVLKGGRVVARDGAVVPSGAD
jgi:cytosine/adenosine deaminase-related metal-dependent hydrolase